MTRAAHAFNNELMNERINELMNERIKDMKASVKIIGYGLWVIGMLLVGMPVMAQQQEWKSTSTMPGVSSTFTPNVQEVGAKYVPPMATTTTDTYTPTKGTGPRRDFDIGGDAGQGPSPIGDAVLPMLLCAAAFAMFVYRRRKQTLKS